MIPAFARYLFLLLVALPGLHPHPAIADDDPGPSVVQQLQERFDDTRPACEDGSAAFNCNGVLIRAIRGSSDPKFWNPSPANIEREGVSFSYFRADVGNTLVAGNAGLILQPLGESTLPLTVRCVFPVNAATDSRVKSCATEEFPLPCHLSGVTDIPTWQAHFAQYTGTKACYFEPTARWFQFSIDVREHFPHPDQRRIWNEVVIAPWSQDIPEQLPIEALYFSNDGLEQAREMQVAFIQASGRFIPIIRVALTHPDQVFFYAPRDQSQAYLAGLGMTAE